MLFVFLLNRTAVEKFLKSLYYHIIPSHLNIFKSAAEQLKSRLAAAAILLRVGLRNMYIFIMNILERKNKTDSKVASMR